MKSIVRILVIAALAFSSAACSDDMSDPANVVDALREDSRFTTLVGALEATGLAEALEGEGPFTVFAPTNDAFALLPAGLVGGLTPAELTDVLLYHAVDGEFRAADVVMLESADTKLPNAAVSIQVFGTTVVLDGRVQVTQTDIVTGNGVVHVLDAVLFFETFPGTVVDALAASPRFSTLVGAVVGEMLDGPLGGDNGGDGFTVFAPSNEAFDLLPGTLVVDLAADGLLDDVLTYHVIGATVDSAAAIGADGTSVPTLLPDGGGFFEVAVAVDGDGDLFLDGRTQVVSVDIVASNGIVHALDSVLVPGGGFPGTLVEALMAYPRFDSLVDAVVAEGLAGAVNNVTVFAPTNDAFAGADLMGNALSDVLAYHLLGDVLDSTELMPVEPTLLSGQSLSIAVGSGVVINGSSNVIRADIEADDGIIHVIDAVLVPAAP